MSAPAFHEATVLVQGSQRTVERLVGDYKKLGEETGAIVTEINSPDPLPKPEYTLPPLELTTPAHDLIPSSVLRSLGVSNWVLTDMLEKSRDFAITIFGRAAVDRINAAGYFFAGEPQPSCQSR